MSENIFDRILILMKKHGLNQSAFAKKSRDVRKFPH